MKIIYQVAVIAQKKEEKECHKFWIGNRNVSTFYGLPWPGLPIVLSGNGVSELSPE